MNQLNLDAFFTKQKKRPIVNADKTKASAPIIIIDDDNTLSEPARSGNFIF